MSQLFKLLGVALFLIVLMAVMFRYGNRELFLVMLSLGVSTPVVYLVIDRFAQKNDLLEMKERALRAELGLLKNQINPHFFFNTLNNLYSMAVTQSAQTPHLILKLSDLMRFTIYEGKKERVLLRDELAYLKNYLDIQRIRAKMEKVHIEFKEDVQDDLIEIPPLLLIILVENAVKHGVETLTEKAFIHIQLKSTLDTLTFSLENNYEERPGHIAGIGMSNLKRRLELLFPSKHLLKSSGENGIYHAELRLEL